MKTPAEIAAELVPDWGTNYSEESRTGRERKLVVDAILADRAQPENDGTVHSAVIQALKDRADDYRDADEGYYYRHRAIAWIEENPDEFWEEFAVDLLDDIERKFWTR